MKKSVEKLVFELETSVESYEFIEEKLKLVSKKLKEVNKNPMMNSSISKAEKRKLFSSLSSILSILGVESDEKERLLDTVQDDEKLAKELDDMLDHYSIIKKVFGQMKQFFSATDEELKSSSNIIDTLMHLSTILEECNFKDNEVYEIVCEFARRSDLTGIVSKSTFILDPFKLYSYSFESVTKEQKEYYLSKGVRNILDETVELDEIGKSFVAEIRSLMEQLTMPVDNIEIKLINKIINVLVHKKDCYCESDIEEVLEALSKLQLSDENLVIMERCLKRDLEKIRKKESKQVSSERKITTPTTASTKYYISDAEYKKLKKEVLKFYDLHTGELKQELSYEETLEVASIMIRLDYDKPEVYAFLMRALKKEEVTSNIIASFIRDYNKYIYYLGKESLLDILEYLKEMVISNDEDYMYWKSGVEEAINELNKQLPYKVDYEYELAKKM